VNIRGNCRMSENQHYFCLGVGGKFLNIFAKALSTVFLFFSKFIAQRVFGTSGPHECLVLNVSHVYDQFTNGNRLQARRV